MKTYQLIALKSHMQHVDILKDGKTTTKTVEFKGGSRSQGRLIPGTFKTDDPDIIKSLEKSPNMNKKWKLVFDSEDPKVKEKAQGGKVEKPKAEKVEKPKAENAEKNPPTGSETPEGDKSGEEGTDNGDEGKGAEGDEKTFPEVTTGQAAKQILLKGIEGLKVSDVNSNAQVKEVAEKHGFSFPNLNA